jgi:hypothetical protein
VALLLIGRQSAPATGLSNLIRLPPAAGAWHQRQVGRTKTPPPKFFRLEGPVSVRRGFFFRLGAHLKKGAPRLTLP